VASKTSMTFSWESATILADVDKAMAAGLKAAGLFAKKEMQAALSGPADSPEGGPPGQVSGTLRKSITARAFKKKGKYVGVRVGVPIKSPYDSKAEGKPFPGRMHAQAVRLAAGFTGRDRKGRIYNQRPRPFAEPTIKRNKAKISALIKDEAGRYMPKPKEKR